MYLIGNTRKGKPMLNVYYQPTCKEYVIRYNDKVERYKSYLEAKSRIDQIMPAMMIDVLMEAA